MISHKHKCIFIHIQRTAGSSIEHWIVGHDWFNKYPKTKHLLASQAKELYKDYWDDYFKFSFVRNPWDRMVSMLKFRGFSKVKLNNKGILDLSGYKKKWGYPLTVENDNRFSNQKDLIKDTHQEYCVYGNILDEELDFIGKFENIHEDAQFIRDKLGIKQPFNHHYQKMKKRKNYRKYYDEKTKEELRNLYYYDIEKFGYEF